MNETRGKGFTRSSRVLKIALTLAMAGGLSGCMFGPNFKAPDAPMAEKWREAENPKFMGQPASNAEWWKTLNDPTLESLINQAFAQNLNLHTAALRIVESRLGRTLSVALMFPAVVAEGSAAHIELSKTVKPDVEVSAEKPSLPPFLTGKVVPPKVSITPELDVYSVHADALWEPDLWGKGRRRMEAKGAELRAAYADYDAIMVSVAGEVASTYVQLRVLQHRLVALKENVEVMKKFQQMTSDRVTKKDSPETDMYLANTLTAIVASGVPAIEMQIRQTENALCVLLGKMPQDMRAELGESGPIPTIPASVAMGIPPDLLRRRPDVRKAEELAHAQCARLGMAKANLMPSFSIFGSLGYQSSDSGKLFDSDSKTSAYGGLVSVTNLLLYPITVEKVRMEDAEYEEAILGYKSAVLTAALEVEDAMTGFLKSQEAHDIIADGAVNAKKAADTAVNAYGAGKVIVSVPLVALTFEAQLQDQEIASQGAGVMNMIKAYKALGGGWESRTEKELIPDDMRARMKDRSDWSSWTASHDMRTQESKPGSK